MNDTTYDRIYTIVRQIPIGHVTTYGRVATLAGLDGKARLVGYALFKVATDSPEIPWQRVINAKGEISHSSLREGSDYLQRALLEAEGIQFDDRGKLDLKRYGWPTPWA
ncbi:MAG: methyltransferase [Oscillatoriales cyanobacterium]|nr:MAG: methyltransferase [Oscillatoriales cyanobacterium]